MDGAASRRKNKANSADEFPFGILDQDDLQLEDEKTPN